jgi:hypothetical protein
MYLKKIEKTINQTLLKEWFKEVREKFPEREFDPFKHFNEIRPEYQTEILKDPKKFNQSGYSITSNISDMYPQPFLNCSIRPNVEEHLTPIAFGYIREIMIMFPNCVGWSVSCQRSGGMVGWHKDKHDQMALWIPIQTDSSCKCVGFRDDTGESHYCLEDNGSIYIANNRVSHCTYNNSNIERIMIICYFKVNDLEQMF